MIKLFDDITVLIIIYNSDQKISNWESFISLVNELGAKKSITEYYLLPSC